MNNSPLDKSSLYNLLCETGKQQAEGRVRSKSLLEEMSLIGFIPYTDYYIHQLVFGTVDLNNHLYVAPYLVKFSKDTPAYPYFKTITRATDKKYRIDEKLYLDPILDEIPSSTLQNVNIKFPFNGNQLLNLMNRRWDKKDLIIKNEDFTFDYVGRKGEFELSCGLGKIVAISNNFLCLCTYINKVTGYPSYTVLPSDDTIRVFPESNDIINV